MIWIAALLWLVVLVVCVFSYKMWRNRYTFTDVVLTAVRPSPVTKGLYDVEATASWLKQSVPIRYSGSCRYYPPKHSFRCKWLAVEPFRRYCTTPGYVLNKLDDVLRDHLKAEDDKQRVEYLKSIGRS